MRYNVERYRPLGLIANPFVSPPRESTLGVALEVAAASNSLLAAIADAAATEAPKPIVVMKSNDIPSSYSLRAIGDVEAALIRDNRLNVVHAYIQLYMLRKGRVRSTLGTVAERIAFRSFEQTLAAYLETVLEAPDDQLASYQVLGAEALATFAEAFRADPVAVTIEYFGEPEIEKRPELAQVADIRLSGLDADVEESEDVVEVDTTIGDAPGTGIGLPEADEAELQRKAVADYLIEYTSMHLSKVIARGLRVYRERGLAAMSSEWKVTKAPRKTLAALARFASFRFKRLAIIYDGFENWLQIAPELRRTIVLTLSEVRWMLDTTAVFVLLLEDGVAPEVEEQFSAGPHIRWDFPSLAHLQKNRDGFDPLIVSAWIEAARVGDGAMSLDDPVLAALAQECDGSLNVFVTRAAAAIEDAAQRGVSALDDAALAAARECVVEDAEVS